MGGSTTYALNLLSMLVNHGAEVTLLITSAYSRSPRLWFRVIAPPPPGVKLVAPRFLRFGSLYLNLFSLKAWARFTARATFRFPWLRSLRSLTRALFGQTIFLEAWDLSSPTVAECALSRRMIEHSRATTAIANYAFFGPLLSQIPAGKLKRVIVMHDLLSARVQRFLAAGVQLDCPAIDETTEMHWLNAADTLLAAQSSEAGYVRARIGTQVLVLPVVLPVHASTRPPEPARCLFVGTNIPPNINGINWLLAEVWPAVLARCPRAELVVVGTVCNSVPDGNSGILKLGPVDSIAAEYEKATVVLVPLLVGSGIKIKLIEAFSFGKATVSTSVGIQGLEDWAPGAVEVADAPTAFAERIVQLLENPALREQREQAALALAEQHYGLSKPLDADFIAAVF